MNKKLRIGIIFGGKSAEHEVSLRSAQSVLEALDKDKYEPVLIAIDKNGKWLLSDPTLKFSNTNIVLPPESEGILMELSNKQSITPTLDPSRVNSLHSIGSQAGVLPSIDVAFPILHGPLGEDGTIQGLLKLADIPFVGASVLGSAIGMDKDVMKRLLRDAGMNISKFEAFKQDHVPNFEEAIKNFGTPLFIKPANMGSSVGISKVKNEIEYKKAVEDAFKFDTKIIIEEYVKGREIECSILGNDNPEASLPGEVIPTLEFYSYDAKYGAAENAKLEIPAKLTEEEITKIQNHAIKAYKTLCCEGMGRVDCFLTENGEVYINEINTIPGFTASISMYPKMWEVSGLPYNKLIDKLIELAIDRFQKEKKLLTSYQ